MGECKLFARESRRGAGEDCDGGRFRRREYANRVRGGRGRGEGRAERVRARHRGGVDDV